MQAALPNVLGPKEVHPQNLHGRTAVVTGGVHGIGFEIARALASAGAKVIIVGRKKDHADDAISTVKSETPDADISWEECDLGKLSQVQSPFDLDADGIDRHFGVNYLGQYYATNQLWPLIRKTSNMPRATAPRIVSLSSEVHKAALSDVQFKDMNEINNQNTGPTHLYGRTKLALLLFTKFGLVDKVIKPNSDNISALAVHPGTKDAYPGITGQLISWAMKSVGRSPEQGAFSALWALTAPEITKKDQNGGLSSQAQDAPLGKNPWDLSEQIIKDKLGNDALVDWSAK
ncbi:hypothetical protein V8F06_011730 [Rhypophila decipiens]